MVARAGDDLQDATGGNPVRFDGLATVAPQPPPAPVDPGSLALVIYTSGSTADPKGAMHSHQTLAAELASLVVAHGLGDADRVLMPSPLTHVSGVIHGILAPALLGTSAVLEERWEPGAALRDVARHRVTYMIGAPTFLQEMLAQPDLGAHDLTSLRLFSCGGASVAPELMRQGRARIPGLVTKRSYGSSEFPTIATTGVEDALARGQDTEGRALAHVELRITDEAGSVAAGRHRGRDPRARAGLLSRLRRRGARRRELRPRRLLLAPATSACSTTTAICASPAA